VPGAVDRVASVGASVVGLGPWSGGLRLRHVGPRPLVEDGSVRSAPSTLLDARIGWRVAPGVELLLDAFNLLDRRANDIEYWYRSRLPGEPAAGIDDRHLHPAEPRTVRVSLRLGF
jgi:outer membrane receptor protein involved in Fe transport